MARQRDRKKLWEQITKLNNALAYKTKKIVQLEKKLSCLRNHLNNQRILPKRVEKILKEE